jgi:hypothetical protein
MRKIFAKILALETKLAASGKYMVCMDFATTPFSESPSESSQLGAFYLSADGKWSQRRKLSLP